MKIPVAAAALLCCCVAPVLAQSQVTVYGVMDAGLVHESGGPQGSLTKLESGVQGGSRLGFKGEEKLGDGLSATFKLEGGMDVGNGVASQGGRVFGRHTSVGLTGRYGSIDLGRFFNVITNAMEADPFDGGHVGTYTNIINFALRTNNAVYYRTPVLQGFSGELSYGFGEVAGSSRAGRDLGAALGYANGPVTLKLAHEDTVSIDGLNRLRISNLNASYNFKVVKLGLVFNTNRDDVLVDSSDVLLGVTVPCGGAGSVMASYIRHRDHSRLEQDASQTAIGYTYSVSKRTNFYTSIARIVRHNGAPFTVGSAVEVGSGDRSMAAGVAHRF
ncbi:porin [Oxalobacteraceae bacterium]|nr:porin [Oxalobacteraceae bacterium]